jgi:hypothetical protein
MPLPFFPFGDPSPVVLFLLFLFGGVLGALTLLFALPFGGVLGALRTADSGFD